MLLTNNVLPLKMFPRQQYNNESGMASSSVIIISLGILLALCFDSSRSESVGAPENKECSTVCCIREKQLAQDQ